MIEIKNINIETALKDAEIFHKLYPNQGIYPLKVNKENITNNIIYYVTDNFGHYIPAGFYNYADAEKINSLLSVKTKINKNIIIQVWKYIETNNIPYIDYFTCNDLLYHSEGNWINKIA